AKVQLLIAGGDLDSSILRPAPFGDVHLRQNLHARKDGAQQAPRGTVALDEDAIDPVTNPHPVFKRFDVDVRSTKLDGLGDYQMDKPHDGGAGFVDDLLLACRLIGRL